MKANYVVVTAFPPYQEYINIFGGTGDNGMHLFGICKYSRQTDFTHNANPVKTSGVKWPHFEVFRAILVQPTIFNFLTFGHSGAQD